MSEHLVTIEEAADHISCQPTTVRRMVQRGEIPALKIGRQYRVRMSDLVPEFQAAKPDAPKAVARPVAYPPGVPGERVEAMRTAFMQMAKDPEVLAEAEKSGIPLDPSDHRSIEKVVDLVESASPEVIERLRGIIASK